jgi:hypothetical protein
MKWDATHGAYFQDLHSGKSREIDVLARKIWGKASPQGQEHDQTVQLTAIIEVKSMKGGHLLFSPKKSRPLTTSRQCIWLGYLDQPHLNKLSNALQAKGLEKALVRKLLHRIQSYYFPDGVYRMQGMMPNPQNGPIVSAFRETSIKGKKKS